jgi:CheY-like chemotaxis protein
VPPTALLVDHDADSRRMYAEYLEFAAWHTEQADDGHEAFVKALRRPHDVIVMATRLPFINGYDLCRMLKSHGMTAMTPIVFVTGDGFQSDIERARTAGADLVLIKPCLPDTLLLELHRRCLQRPAVRHSTRP